MRLFRCSEEPLECRQSPEKVLAIAVHRVERSLLLPDLARERSEQLPDLTQGRGNFVQRRPMRAEETGAAAGNPIACDGGNSERRAHLARVANAGAVLSRVARAWSPSSPWHGFLDIQKIEPQ